MVTAPFVIATAKIQLYFDITKKVDAFSWIFLCHNATMPLCHIKHLPNMHTNAL